MAKREVRVIIGRDLLGHRFVELWYNGGLVSRHQMLTDITLTDDRTQANEQSRTLQEQQASQTYQTTILVTAEEGTSLTPTELAEIREIIIYEISEFFDVRVEESTLFVKRTE